MPIFLANNVQALLTGRVSILHPALVPRERVNLLPVLELTVLNFMVGRNSSISSIMTMSGGTKSSW